ncbi:hypothetical protein HYU23_03630 [Candidatus Woesearchaeota archaeon]|nr:hypothetical protein [Candidatus Woesearchaeota archaeon]
MILHKNKKGIFLLLYVGIYIFILGALLSVINTAENNKVDFVGLRAINIIKVNQESDKANMYLELASKHSYKEALNKLAENGGYYELNRCEKTSKTTTEQEEYVIWNSCPVLNPSASLVEQIKRELKQYLNIYQSNYYKTELENQFDITKTEKFYEEIPEGVRDAYNYLYTKNIQNTNIIKVEFSNEDVIITFSDIAYLIENDEPSYITSKPQIYQESSSLSIYEDIYNSINNNCINKEKQECENEIKKDFKKIQINNFNNLILVRLPTKTGTIKFAFDPKKPLPEYQETEQRDYEFSEEISEEIEIDQGLCNGLISGLIPVNQDDKIKCQDKICCARPETVAQIDHTRKFILSPSQYLLITDAARSPKSQSKSFLDFLAGGAVACGPKGIDDKHDLARKVPNSDKNRAESARNWLAANDPATLEIIDDLDRYSGCKHVEGRAVDIRLAKGKSDEDIRELFIIMCSSGWANFGGEWWHYEYKTKGYDNAKRANKCYFSEDIYASIRPEVTPGYA